MRRIALFSLFIGLLLAIGLGGVVWWMLQPINQDAAVKTFVVRRGEGVASIAERLTEQGLIRSPWVFRGVVRWRQLDQRIQAGSFQLASSLSPVELAERLTQGTQDVWITLLEGWRREEIAAALVQAELTNFDPEVFIDQTASLEGQLYPDTYLVPRAIDSTAVINLLTSTFRKKVVQALADELDQQTRSLDEVLVLASILEREGRGESQYRQIAGVLENRLAAGMPLQVDATLQYIRGYDVVTQTWWPTPLAADRSIKSPFNTYLNVGLPPRPICNPSSAAVAAVLAPASTNNLFYLHAPTGEIFFAQTYEQHQANINRYLR